MESNRLSRPRGIALIVVLIIIFTLMVIAAPFVHSMVLQERTSFLAINESKAAIGIQSAQHHAFYQLQRTHEYNERRFRTGGSISYASDSRAELQVRLDPTLAETLKVGESHGILWGTVVEDEQGKINLNRMPVHVSDNIVQISEMMGGDPREFTTLYSVRESRWVHPQRARYYTPGGPVFHNLNHFGAGARVRVSSPSMTNPFFTTSEGLRDDPQTGAMYVVLNPRPRSGNDLGAIYEVEARTPVNVNTASPEALAVVFRGLRVQNPQQPTSVVSIDDNTAINLASSIYGYTQSRSFANFYDFSAYINGQPLADLQKIAVLINSVDPTHVLLLGSGTLPLTFKSHDIYTVRTSCSVNGPLGDEQAVKHARTVVDLTPPVAVQHRIETQYDWERFYSTFAGVSAFIKGYPWGNRIITLPNRLPTPPVVSLDDAASSYIQVDNAKDERGQVAALGGRRHFRRYHFDGTVDGQELKGNKLSYPHTDVFVSTVSNVQYADIPAGGIEFWLRFNDAVPPTATLFDIREGASLNRLSLEFKNSELVLSAADETLQGSEDISNGLIVTRMPFDPKPDVWYHVGGYFKGNKFGQMLLMRDGFSHPQSVTEHQTPGGAPISTTLAADLMIPPQPGPNISAVSLADASWLPSVPVPLEIGNEVVIYDPTTGNALRGARGTSMRQHPAGSYVSIFGYATQLISLSVNPANIGNRDVPQGYRVRLNGIPAGSTTLASPVSTNDRRVLAADTPAADLIIPVVSSQFMSNPDPSLLAAEQSSLQADFPPVGYVKVRNEMIKYTGFTTKVVTINAQARNITVPALQGVLRGALGTIAADQRRRRRVDVASLHVSDNTVLPEPIVVAVGNEWFGPLVRDPSDASLYVPPTNDQNAHRLGRSLAGTGRRTHAIGDRVLPVFAARPRVAGGAPYKLGGGDEVTITNSLLQRALAYIQRAVGLSGNTQLAALNNEVANNYLPDVNGYSRILKFPSGELLGRSWLIQSNPSLDIGPLNGHVDEIKFFASPKSPEWRISDPLIIENTSSHVEIAGSGSMNRLGGAVVVGGEVIGYEELNTTLDWLTDLHRGYLNSPIEVHNRGDRLFNLAFLPISTLSRNLGPNDASIPLRQGIDINANEGYVLIDEEVLFFTRKQGMGLDMPTRLRNGDGLYRGMFGTAPASHSQKTLIYGIPYRHFDTYKANEFHNTMGYYQTSTSIRDAHWSGLTWQEKTWPDLVTHLQVRFDQQGEWFDGPNNKTLFDFTAGNSAHRLDYHSARTDDALLEMRLQFEYKPGAFHPGDAWKQSPLIYDMTVEYERPWRVLYHEEQ